MKNNNSGFAARIIISKSASIGYRIFHYSLLTLLAFILMYPLMYMFSMALRPVSELLDPTVVWIPREITFDNIIKVWERIDFTSALFQSTLISVGTSVLQIMTCAITGYGFAKFDFKFKGLLFGMVLLTIIVPPQTIIIPSYLQFRYFDFFGLGNVGLLFGKGVLSVNLLDTPWTFFIPGVLANGLRSGLFIYIFRQFFRGLPKELEDAANIDGCGMVKTFVKIVIPCASGAFVSTFLFSLIWYWNDYFYGSMMLQSSGTLSLALAGLKDSFNGSSSIMQLQNPYEVYALLQAGCLLMVLPMLIVFIFFQRLFVESIERTGIVG